MASRGTYRIQSTSLNKEFQAPNSTAWNEQLISTGLNGIPINSGYRVHVWNFENMEGCDFEDLATLFQSQQDNNSQLSELETDAHNATEADERYQTVTYTDFIIQSISPQTRGLPLYQSVTVTLEVFIS